MSRSPSQGEPEVAVLLAIRNGMQWLPEQLESIINQRGVSVSLFASVDASSDGTEAWLQEYAKNCPALNILPAGEFGGAAKNFFRLVRDVDFAKFDYVAFADQDDIWNADKLLSGHVLISQERVHAYSANVTAFWPDGRNCFINKARPQRKFDFLFEAAGPGCTYILSRPVADGFKVFLDAHWQAVNQVALHDWLVYAWVRAAGWRWYIDPRPMLLYRQHGKNQMGANRGGGALLRRFKLIRKGWYRAEVDKIFQLVCPLLRQRGVLQEVRAPDRKFLLKNICQLRRSPKDRIYFFILLLFNFY